MRAFRFAVLPILLVIVFIAAAFLPDANALAQDTRGVAIETISPHGTITDKTPAYKWSKVTGATIYRFQVWQNSTLVLDKSPDSSACGTTICTRIPTFALGTKVYKWRVKYFKDATWSAWTPFMSFTVSAAGFDNQFQTNGDLEGWARKSGGTWSVVDSKFLYTSGLPDTFSSAIKVGKYYTDFEYEARMLRYGPDVNYIAFRMGNTVGADGLWYPGYIFGYTNDGQYGVFKIDATGAVTTIQAFTSSAAINKDAWNALRVSAIGSNFIIYINSTLVYTFSDSSYKRGTVGIITWREDSSVMWNYFVDYAKLIVIQTAQ